MPIDLIYRSIPGGESIFGEIFGEIYGNGAVNNETKRPQGTSASSESDQRRQPDIPAAQAVSKGQELETLADNTETREKRWWN